MQQTQTLDEQIMIWQRTQDEVWAESLIAAYRPFILKTISTLSGRFIEIENDDEFSVGLQAFYEAMQRFDARGNFLAFARLVIASRLKTFWQKEKHPVTLCLEELELSSDDVDRLVSELSMADDIRRFAQELAHYGLDFSLLVQHSPKHRDTREAVLTIARQVSQSPGLMALIWKKKRLPIREIVRQLGVSPKVVKRNKIYLLAAALVFANPDSEMADWLQGVLGKP